MESFHLRSSKKQKEQNLEGAILGGGEGGCRWKCRDEAGNYEVSLTSGLAPHFLEYI